MDIEVQSVDRIDGTVNAPPSKSYTHRAFIMAFLAEGTSNIKDPLYSEDTLASLNSCITFGSRCKTL